MAGCSNKKKSVGGKQNIEYSLKDGRKHFHLKDFIAFLFAPINLFLTALVLDGFLQRH
jgi:hypothetical protein